VEAKDWADVEKEADELDGEGLWLETKIGKSKYANRIAPTRTTDTTPAAIVPRPIAFLSASKALESVSHSAPANLNCFVRTSSRLRNRHYTVMKFAVYRVHCASASAQLPTGD
jgi:hypothetical protein